MAVELELDLRVSHRQRVAFYAGIFLLGLLSLFSVRYQNIWLKILRPPLVLGGAIAGVKLLYDYRPIDRDLEQEERQKQLQQEAVELENQKQLMQAEQAALVERLQQMSNEQVQSFQKQYDDQREFYEGQIQLLQAKIADLNALELFTAKHAYAGWLGNQVINTLLEYEIACDAEDCHTLPNGDTLIWVKPRQGVRVRKLKELAEEIQLRLGLEDAPDLSIDDDSICINLKPSTQRKTKKEGKEKEAVQQPNKWFPESVHISNHYLIAGDTGSGKSELVNNIVCIAKQELGDDVRIIIIDPKFPETEWIIDGVEVLPQYKGYQSIEVDGTYYPSAYDGIYAMADDMYQRLEDATKAKLRSQAIPKRIPTLYIVDEVPDLIANAGDAKADVVNAILSVVRVGRSSKVKCLLLGQDPGCLAYGFKTTATLKNFSCFYLREFALKGIDDLVPTTVEKGKLKTLVQKQLKAAQTDKNEQYFALIKYPGRAAFVAKLPAPKAYSKSPDNLDFEELETAESIEDLVEYAAIEEGARI